MYDRTAVIRRCVRRVATGLFLALAAMTTVFAQFEATPPQHQYVVIGPDLYFVSFVDQRYHMGNDDTWYDVAIKRAIFPESGTAPYDSTLLQLGTPPSFRCEDLAICLLKLRRPASDIALWRHVSTYRFESAAGRLRWTFEYGADSIAVEGDKELFDEDLGTTSQDPIALIEVNGVVDTIEEGDLIEFRNAGSGVGAALELQWQGLSNELLELDAFYTALAGAALISEIIPDDTEALNGGVPFGCETSCGWCIDDAHAAFTSVQQAQDCSWWDISCMASNSGSAWGSAASGSANCQTCFECIDDTPSTPDPACSPQQAPCLEDPFRCCETTQCPFDASPCGFHLMDCCYLECDPNQSTCF